MLQTEFKVSEDQRSEKAWRARGCVGILQDSSCPRAVAGGAHGSVS